MKALSINEKGGSKLIETLEEFEEFEKLISKIENSETKYELVAGSSCSNTLKGLAALLPKGYCAIMGKLGNDKMGKLYTEAISKRGVIPILSISDHLPTGQCICLITPDGERTMRTYLGASSEMLVGDLMYEDFDGIKLFHVEGYGVYHKNLTLKSLKFAKNENCLISYDLGSFEIVQNYK